MKEGKNNGIKEGKKNGRNVEMNVFIREQPLKVKKEYKN